ncbi:MAG: peptidase Ste24p [Sediminibacterium sp.]|nr:peptidase Ste24p [Sediminibacterium sp.]
MRATEKTNTWPLQSNSVIQTTALDIYRQYLSSHKKIAAGENPDLETVNRVGNQVIVAVKDYYKGKGAAKELEGFFWEINFIEERKADAWCFPGGKIAVYSSLLPVTQSEGSLAAVLAHEIAHVVLKHGDIRMKQYLKQYLGGKDLAASLAANPLETKDFFRMAYANGDYVGVIRGFDTKDEMAADELGAILTAMAGYKAQEAVVFLERMIWFRNTGRTPEYVLSHPIDEKRTERLKEIVDDIARKYYRPISKN